MRVYFGRCFRKLFSIFDCSSVRFDFLPSNASRMSVISAGSKNLMFLHANSNSLGFNVKYLNEEVEKKELANNRIENMNKSIQTLVNSRALLKRYVHFQM